MKWIRQGIAFYRNHLRHALYLACASLLILVLSSLLGFFGACLTAIGFIYLQALVFLKIHTLPAKNLSVLKNKNIHFSLLWLSALLLPTNIMVGSLIGILYSNQSPWLMLTMLAGIGPVIALTYLVVFHCVGYLIIDGASAKSAFDKSSRGIFQNLRASLSLLGIVFLILVASVLPLGLGLVFSLPLMFYASGFSFYDFRDRLTLPAPR